MKKNMTSIAAGLLTLTMALSTTACSRIDTVRDSAENAAKGIGTALELIQTEITARDPEDRSGDELSDPAHKAAVTSEAQETLKAEAETPREPKEDSRKEMEDEPVKEPEEEPARPAQPLEVSFERMDSSILDDDGDALIERYFELPRVSEDTAAGRKINDVFYEDYEQYLALLEENREYVDEIAEGIKENGYPGGVSLFFNDITGEVVQNDGGILAVQYNIEEFMGGPHGCNEIYGTAVDVTTGERVLLSQLVTPEGKPVTMAWIRLILQQYIDSHDIGSWGLEMFGDYYTLDTVHWVLRDGEVCICVWKYDVASAAYGSFEVPTGIRLTDPAADDGEETYDDAEAAADETAAYTDEAVAEELEATPAGENPAWEIYRPILEEASAHDNGYYGESEAVLLDLDGDGIEELLVIYQSFEDPFDYINAGLYGSDGMGGYATLYKTSCINAGGAHLKAAVLTLDGQEYLGILYGNYDGGDICKWDLLELESGEFNTAHTLEYYTMDEFSGETYEIVSWGWLDDEEISSEDYSAITDPAEILIGHGENMTASELMGGK